MNSDVSAKLRELLTLAHEHGIMEMAWQENGMRIAFRRSEGHGKSTEKSAEPVEASSNGSQETPEAFVKSPMVGTFRRSPSKGRPPLVMEGNHVKPGDRLGVVECMKIPTDVISYCEGQIKKILVEDGKPVEYGQALFEIVTNGAWGENGDHV